MIPLAALLLAGTMGWADCTIWHDSDSGVTIKSCDDRPYTAPWLPMFGTGSWKPLGPQYYPPVGSSASEKYHGASVFHDGDPATVPCSAAGCGLRAVVVGVDKIEAGMEWVPCDWPQGANLVSCPRAHATRMNTNPFEFTSYHEAPRRVEYWIARCASGHATRVRMKPGGKP